MPYTVDADHFSKGSWAADGPLHLRAFSCVCCGHRSVTWPAFRAHRATCVALAPGETTQEPGWLAQQQAAGALKPAA